MDDLLEIEDLEGPSPSYVILVEGYQLEPEFDCHEAADAYMTEHYPFWAYVITEKEQD